MITRRKFLEGGAALGAGALAGKLAGCADSCGGGPPPVNETRTTAPARRNEHEPPQPNIVYIFSDQHRGDALGAVGHPVIQTPNLDRLAEQGVTFGRCYTAAPLCRPARVSMMTGLYPHDHGVWHNANTPSADTQSHVARLRDEAGYLTAVIGKTHLHRGEKHLDNYQDLLSAWGFEHSHELPGPGEAAYIESKYTDWLRETTPAGEENKATRYKKYVDEFIAKHFVAPWDVRPLDEPPTSFEDGDHIDRYTGRVAADWIRSYDDTRPFYLQVNFPGPHDPFDSLSSYRKRYDPSNSRWPVGISEAPRPPFSGPIRISRNFQDVSGITPEQRTRLQLAYFAKISMIDESVGDVFRALDERGRDRDTWIIYGSDHGEMLGDHQLVQKTVFYEPSVHVPLIARPPGGVKGWRSDGLTDTLDVTSSILEVAGLAPDKERGRSLVGRIEAGPSAANAQRGKEWVLSENYRHGMVRTSRYKLVANYKTVRPAALYDLDEDPRELRNLVTDSAYQRVLEQLAEMMRERVPAHVWGKNRQGTPGVGRIG